ncbi:ChbG/HpnK family deacetylase [Allocoprobacillus halotolerans]|uniref:ChbG/HpnK family deacetylase n=1 Tax=Allocoprobacillus halotolerans TaxID=2944914 RepID=A0ABY5I4P2_9FIRM|nr:ChbG/HpnK family deacetylase [Allocoprobacillus halotolerans]UTY40316.1 ChbG/HpnK family deacetylase [Allocoprobacillus halotolerans]
MKLLVQADDYGISKAVSLGIIHGIKNGMIRNTGLFANMEWTKECVEYIKPYLDQIDFGIDLNITTGKPLLPKEKIPSLVKENGEFFTSWEMRELQKHESTLFKIEVYAEFETQILKFIELVGKKPDYIHSHAFTNESILEVQRQLSKKYDIPFASDVWKKTFGCQVTEYRIPWYLKPANLENQMNSSLSSYILTHADDLLKNEYNLLVGHMGYVDRELVDLSSYHLYRLNDLEGACNPEVLEWIHKNNVQLIRYKDII